MSNKQLSKIQRQGPVVYLGSVCQLIWLKYIIEITMRWTGITNKAAMMASLMGLLEKNTTITTLSIQCKE